MAAGAEPSQSVGDQFGDQFVRRMFDHWIVALAFNEHRLKPSEGYSSFGVSSHRLGPSNGAVHFVAGECSMEMWYFVETTF